MKIKKNQLRYWFLGSFLSISYRYNGMAPASFAEILREKIEKSRKETLNRAYMEEFSSTNMVSLDSPEWARLQAQLLERKPHTLSQSSAKLNATPYYKFHISPLKEWVKKGHTRPNKVKEPEKQVPRPKGVPHKLNEKQSQAMRYFFQEMVFLLEDFTIDELKKAYRKLALVKHPDRQAGSTQHFLELSKHYETLATVFKK